MTEGKPPLRRVITVLGSRKFFWAVLLLFVLQAVWIALSGRYPMAFDEEFHMGVIHLYAHHLNPFLANHPPGADAFGSVARDPSYLYHYLMSFPYRLVGVFTHDQTIRVLVLRMIDVGLFAWGLVLWRRLLLKTRASGAIVNLTLLIFVLIPVAPFLAAQVNYDNLFVPLTALALLWTVELSSKLTKDKRVDGALVLKLAILCMLNSLVKYAFIPVFITIIVYLVVKAVRTLGGWGGMWNGLYAGLRNVGKRTGLLLGAGTLLALVLFGQRYGVNIVRYHTPVPSCNKVLTVEQCSSYGPWARDYQYKMDKTSTPHNPVVYTWDWLYGMWLRLFFSLAGPSVNYQTRGPLVVPGMGAIIFTGAGIVFVVTRWRQVFKRYDSEVLGLLVLAAAFYIGVLWLDEFMSYMRTARPVAINGRYLLPVLPSLILLGALSANEFLNGRKNAFKLKFMVGAIGLVCLLWGGGALTFILRSNDAWYWDNGAVRAANHSVQDVLGPITPGYRHPGQFLH